MLKITKTFSFEVDGVKFEALKPTRRDLLEKDQTPLGLVIPKILKIEGLEYDDGAQIDAEGLKTIGIPLDFEYKIAQAYFAKWGELSGSKKDPEAEEKKAITTESQSS